MAEIGPRLKLIRQNMGITQRELARELGINQAILSKFERGNMVYASVLLDVLSYFRGHIDVNYLLQPGNGFNLNDERHAFSNHSQRDFFIDQIENHTIEKINDSISEAQQDLNKFKEKVEQLVHDMARWLRGINLPIPHKPSIQRCFQRFCLAFSCQFHKILHFCSE